jgi:hypothetical protein
VPVARARPGRMLIGASVELVTLLLDASRHPAADGLVLDRSWDLELTAANVLQPGNA